MKNCKKSMILLVFLTSLSCWSKNPTSSSKPNINIDNKRTQLDVNDLGFDGITVKSNKEEAHLLEVRSAKLQTHQKLGLLTWLLMTSTFLTAPEDGPASSTHKSLGLLTAISYFSTAYYSLSAPEPQGFSEKGWGMKIHRAMLFIHLPGMILTPIAGLTADKDLRNNREPSGLGANKKDLALLTYAAFTTAFLSVTFNF